MLVMYVLQTKRTSFPDPRRSTFAPVFDTELRALSAHPAMAPLPIRQSPSDRAFAARIPPATYGSSHGVRATSAS